MAKNIDFMGAVYSDVPSVRLPQQGGGLVGFDDTTDATATAEDIAQGKTAYVNGQKVTGTGTGGTPVINPLSVTQNGTYSAPSGVDGYSPVTVNVSGGGGSDVEDEFVQKTLSQYTNSTASVVADYAFYSFPHLQSVRLTAVTSIFTNAFCACPKLKTASFPNAIYIGDYAFNSCKSLISIFAPSASRVGNSAFISCHSLTEVSFPIATSIGTFAFGNCSSLSFVDFPEATSIGYSTFRNCIALTTVNLPNATGTLGNNFVGCTNLTSVNIPKISALLSSVFDNCVNLPAISFGESVTALNGANLFRSCYRLVSLYLNQVRSIPMLTHSAAFASTPIGGYSAIAGQYGSIYVPASLYEAFKSATNWQYFSDRMVSV